MVFSKREVVQKIKAGFIPIALKAGTVNNPPPSLEGALYREIARSRPVPQGIAVANGHGKVLAWAIGFDDDDQVGSFFDHCTLLQKRFPDAAQAVATERYGRFPSQKMPDTPDAGAALDLPDTHPEGDRCSGEFDYPAGTFRGQVIGRALDDKGDFRSEARSQETYIEDHFEIPAAAQHELARAARSAGDDSFPVPAAFARALVANAHLGQLDVAPFDAPENGGKIVSDEVELRARRMAQSPLQLSISGRSTIGGTDVERGKRAGHGPLWANRIALDWRGNIELKDNAVTHLAFIAEGDESLEWGAAIPFGEGSPDVAHLPSGRRVKIETKVRYGLTGRRTNTRN